MKRVATALALAAATALTTPATAKDTSYSGSVETVAGSGAADMARGRVFHDTNRNATLDEGESGIEGVAVSNGREVVVTDANGDYELPAYGDMNLFITKPAGYAAPVNEDMVPQFAYVHKEDGSPPLRFGGMEPTGPLPQAVNFPLIEDATTDRFECLVFGDPQPYTNQEVGFVRDTVGRLLAGRDNSRTECMLFEGDFVGDDLSLYPRMKEITGSGMIPQYVVPGNHDLDLDAESDADSYDTFRREFGPEYYSFDIGNVHFVVLDNVRYPCNGVDDHEFCNPEASPSYNGVIHDRQIEWLRNDLANVPEDKLVVLNAHIPFVAFTDNTAAKHNTDNLDVLYEIIGDRPALGLSGHTHTTENIVPGENFEGWAENTNTGAAKFHQIVTGAVSGSWWSGDLNDQGVPHSTMRLGSPRGYYVLEFDGSDYVDTYVRFGGAEDEQMSVSFNTPRFRDWAEALIAYTNIYQVPSDVAPPVTINDLGDLSMVTKEDLEEGTWAVVNVWNGAKGDTVSFSIDGGASIQAERTQEGNGEAKKSGVEYADPAALARQATNGRRAFHSARGGEENKGYSMWQGDRWAGAPGPFQNWMLTTASSHLWRAEMPRDLVEGIHVLEAKTTDRHGRTFTESMTFEVVDEIPDAGWNEAAFN